tara:strand:- start:432 stop:1766 length:1335 start_codon:yes stop_codon:yes gene_type:complete
MSDLFKLDMKSYTQKELEDLLNLKKPYTMENIMENHRFLENKLLVDDTVDIRKKKEIQSFLSQIKDNLNSSIKRTFSDIQTSALIQQNQTILNTIGHEVTESSRGYKDLTINMVPKNEEGIIQKQLLSKVVCISSEFRENYYKTKSSDFTFTLPTKIKNVMQMELVSLEMPLSFYQISRELNNDYFWIKLLKDGSFTSWINQNKWYYISIPQGNYTRKSIQDTLNTIIKNTLPYNQSTTIQDNWVTINNINNKTVFDISNAEQQGNFSLYFNRTRAGQTVSKTNSNGTVDNGIEKEPPILNDSNSPLITGLGWMLGFRLGEYLDSGEFISEGLYNDWSIKHLYFVVDDFNKYANNFIGAAYTKSLGNYNVLARLTTMNPASPGTAATISIDTLFDESFSLKKREYFGPVDIQKLHIQILDPYGRVINLNNMDISFSLHLASLYD